MQPLRMFEIKFELLLLSMAIKNCLHLINQTLDEMLYEALQLSNLPLEPNLEIIFHKV
jgi:hypothetical protein